MRSSSEVYGATKTTIFAHKVPIAGIAGDQQAALFGQACFTPGQAKNTYGTGCFTLMNVGDTPVRSRSGLVTSVGWQVAGKTVYALEGSVFNAGSTIQWLRDELGLIQSAPECDRLAESVPDSGGVVVVPAFTGLGAPYWDMYARGTIVGLTRGSTKAHIARAVLECIAYQTADLVRVMNADAPCPLTELRVDGGASVSDILMQIQADLLRLPVDRPAQVETTAFGAAALAVFAAATLDAGDVVRIIDLELQGLFTRTGRLGYKIKVTEGAKRRLASMGYEARYGVRSLRRTLAEQVEEPLSTLILDG